MDNTTNIEKLRWRCYQIIPLVFDEALSYYEVLCKGAKKTNELIDFVNEMAETVKDNTEEIEAIKSKSGFVLFNGTKEYGNAHAACVDGDFKISDYTAVVVYGDRPYGDGGVVCSVTPYINEESGDYSISGIGNIGLDMADENGDFLLRVFLRYNKASNELVRSQSTKPDEQGNTVHDTITKIIGIA